MHFIRDNFFILGFLFASLLWGVVFFISFRKNRKKVEKLLFTEEMLNQLLYHSPIHVFFKDDKMRALKLSKNYEQLVGMPLKDMFGKTMDDLFPSDFAKKIIADDIKILQEGKAVSLDEEFNGRFYTTIKFPISLHGQPSYLAGFTIDLTEKKLTELALKEATIAANQMTLKAEMASKAKSEFISNISHEIRTPLNAILGFTDYLLETCQDDEKKGYLVRINKSGQDSLGPINNILELSKIESGVTTLDIRPVFLPLLVEDAIEMFRERAQKKTLELKLELDESLGQAYILTDPTKLQRVLINLVNNAIKFTEEGEVCLTIKKEKSSSGAYHLRFEVRDTGIGIAKDKQSLLFQRFSQIDSSASKKYEGTGLGLSISKEIVELMGGGITFESVEHHGSLFTFFIPFIETSERVQEKGEAKKENDFGHKRLQVLIADDSEENRTLLQVYLKNLPFDVDFSVNGAEAYEKFISKRYDIVLMDMQMPDVDGFSATKKIREWEEQEKMSSTPIIALTGFALKEEKQKCLSCGCSFHMAKPFKKAELLKVISDFSKETKNT